MIEKLGCHYSMTNPASVYDEEAMTPLELTGRILKKVNEIIDLVCRVESDANQSLLKQTQALKEALETTIPQAIEDSVMDHINGGSFAGQINAYLNNLNGRLDNLFSMVTTGSTTGDAELYDIRIDANGVMYPTAGNTVRAIHREVLAGLKPGTQIGRAHV